MELKNCRVLVTATSFGKNDPKSGVNGGSPWAASPSGGERGSPSQIPLSGFCRCFLLSKKNQKNLIRAPPTRKYPGGMCTRSP